MFWQVNLFFLFLCPVIVVVALRTCFDKKEEEEEETALASADASSQSIRSALAASTPAGITTMTAYNSV